MKQLQIDLQGPENFRTVVSLMSFSMSASTKQAKSQYMPLGSQNLDAIYRTSCPSTQDLTSSLHMFCCHVLNGLPTCLQVMLHAKLAMTGAGQKAVSLSSLVCGLHQIGNILDHICEHGSWHGCCITYEACTCWEFRTFLFPPAGQLTIFRKRKNPEVPSTKHALHLIKIFLNT